MLPRVRTEAEGGEAEGEVEGGGDEDREAEGHLLTLGGGGRWWGRRTWNGGHQTHTNGGRDGLWGYLMKAWTPKGRVH